MNVNKTDLIFVFLPTKNEGLSQLTCYRKAKQTDVFFFYQSHLHYNLSMPYSASKQLFLVIYRYQKIKKKTFLSLFGNFRELLEKLGAFFGNFLKEFMPYYGN